MIIMVTSFYFEMSKVQNSSYYHTEDKFFQKSVIFETFSNVAAPKKPAE